MANNAGGYNDPTVVVVGESCGDGPVETDLQIGSTVIIIGDHAVDKSAYVNQTGVVHSLCPYPSNRKFGCAVQLRGAKIMKLFDFASVTLREEPQSIKPGALAPGKPGKRGKKAAPPKKDIAPARKGQPYKLTGLLGKMKSYNGNVVKIMTPLPSKSSSTEEFRVRLGKTYDNQPLDVTMDNLLETSEDDSDSADESSPGSDQEDDEESTGPDLLTANKFLLDENSKKAMLIKKLEEQIKKQQKQIKAKDAKMKAAKEALR